MSSCHEEMGQTTVATVASWQLTDIEEGRLPRCGVHADKPWKKEHRAELDSTVDSEIPRNCWKH